MCVFGKQWKLFQFNCDYEYIAHHATISPIYHIREYSQSTDNRTQHSLCTHTPSHTHTHAIEVCWPGLVAMLAKAEYHL